MNHNLAHVGQYKIFFKNAIVGSDGNATAWTEDDVPPVTLYDDGTFRLVAGTAHNPGDYVETPEGVRFQSCGMNVMEPVSFVSYKVYETNEYRQRFWSMTEAAAFISARLSGSGEGRAMEISRAARRMQGE